MSQLLNLMARVKAWCDEREPPPLRPSLDTAVQHLVNYIDTLDESIDEFFKLDFILGQIKLTTKSKYGPELILKIYINFIKVNCKLQGC